MHGERSCLCETDGLIFTTLVHRVDAGTRPVSGTGGRDITDGVCNIPESARAAYKARIWVGCAERYRPSDLDMERVSLPPLNVAKLRYAVVRDPEVRDE